MKACLVYPFRTVCASVPSSAAARLFLMSDSSVDHRKCRSRRCGPTPFGTDDDPVSPFTFSLGAFSGAGTSAYKLPFDHWLGSARVYRTGRFSTSARMGTLMLYRSTPSSQWFQRWFTSRADRRTAASMTSGGCSSLLPKDNAIPRFPQVTASSAPPTVPDERL